MTETNQNTEMWSGDDVVQPFIIRDEEGQLENLHNPPYSAFTYTIRDKPGGTVLVGPKTLGPTGVVVDNEAGGLLHVVFTSADTTVGTPINTAVVGRYQDFYQELEAVKGGKVKTLAEGTYRLHKSIAGA